MIKIYKKLSIFVLSIAMLFVAANAQTCTVNQGDTLSKICKRYGCSLKTLISANPKLDNCNLIKAGQNIHIPEDKDGSTLPPYTNPNPNPNTNTPDTSSDISAIEKEIFNLVNAERSKAGLPPYAYNDAVARCARLKSQDMINNNYFAHNSPVYGSPFDMMSSQGIKYRAAAENIAMGQRNATEVMNAWMNSPGHRANILGTQCSDIGVGVARKSNGQLYFTQQFIRPLS